MRFLLSLFLLLALVDAARAAQMSIPDVCDGPVCLTKILWKKGFTVHTLTGSITTSREIESVNVSLTFSDSKRNGVTELHLRNISKPTDFFFKISNMPADGIKWEQSTLTLSVVAVHAMALVERDGLICKFRSIGSRLSVSINNKTKKDLILDYSLLMITGGEIDLKLNGTTGKYIDVDNPRSNSLIPDGSTHSEELIPVTAAKLVDGEWKESFVLQDALVSKEPKLILPLAVDGKQQLEKIPF